MRMCVHVFACACLWTKGPCSLPVDVECVCVCMCLHVRVCGLKVLVLRLWMLDAYVCAYVRGRKLQLRCYACACMWLEGPRSPLVDVK